MTSIIAQIHFSIEGVFLPFVIEFWSSNTLKITPLSKKQSHSIFHIPELKYTLEVATLLLVFSLLGIIAGRTNKRDYKGKVLVNGLVMNGNFKRFCGFATQVSRLVTWLACDWGHLQASCMQN